jgi:hypothetical protein
LASPQGGDTVSDTVTKPLSPPGERCYRHDSGVVAAAACSALPDIKPAAGVRVSPPSAAEMQETDTEPILAVISPVVPVWA